MVVRDVIYQKLKPGLNHPFVFNLLKAFPTAFLLTWKQPEALGFGDRLHATPIGRVL